jgi:hypothetical protein
LQQKLKNILFHISFFPAKVIRFFVLKKQKHVIVQLSPTIDLVRLLQHGARLIPT